MTSKPRPKLEQIAAWLTQNQTQPVVALAPISGGFWSAAYTFKAGADDLVLRFSDIADSFGIEKAAMAFNSADLPVPEIIEIGQALGHHYAISRRHTGSFLEDVAVEDAQAVKGALSRLLAALRAVPATPVMPVIWYSADTATNFTWHDFLRGGLIDNPTSHTAGWREKLAKMTRLNDIFSACEDRITSLLPLCPERRDLVHGDLLHQNVLISDDAIRVTAVFSWKCSARGDFLYDVAWCTVWSPWHPGIAAIDLWGQTLRASDLNEADLLNAAERHHCYELQIAASHFGWNIWTGNENDLYSVASRAEQILKRGPLPVG